MAWRICAIGRFADDLPERDGVVWEKEASADCDAAIVQGELDRGDWQTASRALSPLVPVGIVGRTSAFLRGDFASPALGPAAIEEMLAVFVPIRERLGDLPAPAGRPDSGRQTILGLAYSRSCTIEGERSPSSPETVIYPLLHGRPGLESTVLRTELESLANSDLLERRFLSRVLTCPTCASGRMTAFEACVECGSANLIEESIIHHYRCGFQDAESRFVQGIDLVCPKCKHSLHHFGVDYGRPGKLIRCAACQQVMTEPQPTFCCLDCGATARGEQATSVDWHHYALSESGSAAARGGDTPRFDMTAITQAFARTFPVKDFVMLGREQLLVSGRYQRPTSIGTISIGNLAAMREKIGVAGADESIRLLIRIIAENLRDTDYATVPTDDTLVVAMPETEKSTAELILGRVHAAAATSLAFPVELGVEVVDGDDAVRLLQKLVA